MLFDCEYGRRKSWRRCIDGFVCRIESHCPDFAEFIVRVTVHDGNLDRRLRCGEAQRFVKSPIYFCRFCCGYPFAVNGGKPTRIEHAFADAVTHLKEISSTIR